MPDFNHRAIAVGIRNGCPFYPSTSSIFDMQKAFWPMDRLIADLYAGEVSFIGLKPMMVDHDGSLGEIVPSVNGFTSCVERMAMQMKIPLDLGLIRRLALRIENGIPIDVTDVDKAALLIDRAKSVFLACPVSVRKAAYVDECIEIEISELGLGGYAA